MSYTFRQSAYQLYHSFLWKNNHDIQRIGSQLEKSRKSTLLNS